MYRVWDAAGVLVSPDDTVGAPMKHPRRGRAAKFRVDEVVRRNGELFQIQMIHRRSDGVFLYYLDGDRTGKKLFGGVWIDEDELRPLTAREKGSR